MTAAVALPLVQGTDEWLEGRRALIGSSDIPIIVGESPYRSEYDLWAEKCGLATREPEPASRRLMDIGKALEPVLLSLYEADTHRKPQRVRHMLRHPSIEWAAASLDARAGRRVVEAKWSSSRRWASGEPVPGDVKAQVQWQLFVTGWDAADVIVLRPNDFAVIELEREEPFIENLVWFAERFHERVLTRTAPPTDGSDATRQALRQIYPQDNGAWLPASAELGLMVVELAEARASKKAAEAREATVSNALRALIGEASGIEGLLAAKKSADSTRVEWPAVAKAYRELLEGVIAPEQREYLDTLVSIHSKTAEGARPLRLLKGAAA